MNTATDNDTNAATGRTFDPPPDAVGGEGLPSTLIRVSADAVRGTVEVLQRLDEFFGRHADDAVRAQLRAFCARLGWHRVCGADTLLDRLGLHAWSLQQALDAIDAVGASDRQGHAENDTTIKESA